MPKGSRINPIPYCPVIQRKNNHIHMVYVLCLAPLTIKDIQVTITENKEIIIFHRKKQVIVDLIKDEEEKYDFAHPLQKTSCVHYVDGSAMSDFNKYRVCNKLAEALLAKDLLSKNVHLTLE